MGLYGCLFIGILLPVILLLAIGLVVLQKVLALFGIHLPIEKFIRMKMGQPFDYTQQQGFQQSQPTSQQSNSAAKKQLYGEDEGEYVEFEEIKD